MSSAEICSVEYRKHPLPELPPGNPAWPMAQLITSQNPLGLIFNRLSIKLAQGGKVDVLLCKSRLEPRPLAKCALDKKIKSKTSINSSKSKIYFRETERTKLI